MRSVKCVAFAVLLFPNVPIRAEDKPEKFELKLSPAKIERNDGELVKLQKERFNAALEMTQLHLMRIETGRDSIAGIGHSVDRLISAGLEVHAEREERLRLLEESLRFAKHIEEVVKLQHGAGVVSKSDLALSRYVRLSAEIQLLKEKEKGKK